MTSRQLETLRRLRRADPAANVDPSVASPSFDELARRAQAAGGERRGPRFVTPRRRRVVRMLVAGAAVTALVVAGNAAGLPGTGGQSVAYGVTSRPDGSVDVRLGQPAVFDRATLQALLTAAGVRATVLVESPAGQCHEPARGGDSSGGKVISVTQKGILTIHPSKLPKDASLLFTLPFAGELGPGVSGGFYAISVMKEPLPTCVAQTVVTTPVGSPYPDPTGQPAPSPAVPTPLPSPVLQNGFAVQSFDGGAVLMMTLNQDARLHAGALQDALRSAGVPAEVLVAGSQSGCHSKADGGVTPNGAFQPYDYRRTVIRPGQLPKGSTVVIALDPNPPAQTFSPWQEMYVATGRAPTCLGSTASPAPS